MQKYINHLKKNNYSLNTIKTYTSVLNRYMKKMENIALIKKSLVRSSLSPNTIHLHYNVILQYMKFKNDKRVSILKQLKLPSIPIKYQSVFTKDFLYKKTTIKEHDNDLRQKKKIVIRFLFETGMRASELFQIQAVNKKSLVIIGKGNKQREIFHNSQTTKYLKDLDFTYKTLRLWTKDVLGSQFTPHSIRRSFATHMLLKGANPKMVSRQLGHSKLETTFRYLHMSHSQNFNVYKKHILT